MESQEQRRLVVVEGPREGRSYPLQGMITTLGRSSDNAIVFDSPRISRHHAQIRLLPQGAVIEDLGSTNGTWLNNQRLTEGRTLSSGDLIRLADYVTLRYVQEAGAKTERMGLAPKGERTVTMGEYQGYEPPAEPAFATNEGDRRQDGAYEPVPHESVSHEPVSPDQAYSPTSDALLEEPPPRTRSRTLYILIGVLVILICLCVAVAVYLWFAPVEFWERVFDWIGIPTPTAYIELTGLVDSVFGRQM